VRGVLLNLIGWAGLAIGTDPTLKGKITFNFLSPILRLEVMPCSTLIVCTIQDRNITNHGDGFKAAVGELK
jgi:hypothetical protein